MALCSKNFKLVYYPGKPWGEFYNLQNDPDEFENLWQEPQYKNIRNEMHAQLLERVVVGTDPLPERKYDW